MSALRGSVAELNADNLRALLEDMDGGPGWYETARLYDWYVSMAEDEKLAPVSKKAFGMALRGLGYRPSIQRVDGKHARGWFITRRALRN